MARKLRIQFEGAFYHVITRGNQRQRIFKDKEDFQKYLDILLRYKELHKYYLYAYVLMNNHLHLLIETKEVPLSKILQGINQSYTAYFNRRYKTVGHLFQGRYKAILCDKDRYLLSLIKYIHLNPVRAKIAQGPEDYLWSSHHAYSRKPNKKGIVDEDQVLRMFSEDKGKARRLYREFMGAGIVIKKEDIYSTMDKRILGDEQFADAIKGKCEAEIELGKRHRQYSLSQLAAAIEDVHGVTLQEMRGKGKDRQITLGRKLLSLVAHEYGYRGKEIAGYMRKDPALITRHGKQKKELDADVQKVLCVLEERGSNVNSQA